LMLFAACRLRDAERAITPRYAMALCRAYAALMSATLTYVSRHANITL